MLRVINKKLKLVLLVCASVALHGCKPSFYKKREKFNAAFENKDYSAAELELLKDKKQPTSKEKLLYFLDLALVQQYSGKYEESNKNFEEAFIINQDFESKTVDTILSFALNPTMSQYNGEDHEILLIHYYKAINYLFLGDMEKALIECKRMNIKLLGLQDKYNGESKYSRDAFMQIIMGLIYQASYDYNNAYIAYVNALDIFETDYKTFFSIPTPTTLIRDAIFCAHMCDFEDKVEELKERYKMTDYDPKGDIGKSDVVVIWHNGLGPIKDKNEIIFIAAPGIGGIVNFENEELGVTFPFPLPGIADENSLLDMKFIKVAFPKYVERKPLFESAYVIIDGQESAKLEIIEDINAISFLILKQRMLWEFSKTLMRVALKQLTEYLARRQNQLLGLAVGVFNFMTEDADTRNWQTLPHSVYYTRVKTKNTGGNKLVFKARSSHSYFEDEQVFLTKKTDNNTQFIVVSTQNYCKDK